MSIKNPPGGFAFEFGSTLTVLTTAAAGGHRGKIGIFTGVVLDETELKFKRGAKHVSVSVTGDYLEDDDYCEQEIQHSKDKDCEWHKSSKEEEPCECHKLDEEEDHDEKKCEVKKEGDFLVLALICSSFPFKTGQIVRISVEQIVSVAVVCRN